MEQPQLPDIRPYVNRSLFSDHFLEELLPRDDSWAVEEDEVRLAMQAALNLYSRRKEDLPHLIEAQLEEEFVRPLLQAMGHVFQVQPSLPTSEGVRRPDYAFFATDEDKRQALRKQKGKLGYFKKAIAVGDAKHWGRPLDKKQRAGADKFDMLSPSWQIDYYLRISEVPWAILTDGRFWRLYNRQTSFRLDVFYQVDLPQLLAHRDIEAFKYFYLFFRRQAFVRDAEGLCFLDRVYQGSLEYARKVGDDLKENVYKALRLLAEGFLETRGNNLDAERDLAAVHQNSLVYLYRLLFINYAEDRRLLPRDTPAYKETYGLVSMEGEIASKLERRQSLSPLQATCWEKLSALFDLINRGSDAFGIARGTLYVPPYNGGLFDPQRHPFLERNKVGDRWLAQVIDLLARSKGEGVGRAFVDYSSLDVRHLGSIYEGLLEYKLRVADREMAAIRRRGREEWVPAKQAEGKKVVETVKAGALYLATDRGERKATGSYYTPDYIVKYIVENTVSPLIEERLKEKDPIEGILSLRVLDPAMGSGHFLVEATDRLAHGLVQALGGTDEARDEDDVRWARREVVERCIYGVDLNPLAVELAKLSLWLHTVAEGKPLNFLDHHLKVGNSLIGAWVDDLGSLPVPRKRGKPKEAEPAVRQMNLFEVRLDERLPVMLNRVLEIMRGGSETVEDIKAKAAAEQGVEQLRAPFKAVADLWVSTYFGSKVTEAEYQEALEHIGEPPQVLALPRVKRGRAIGGRQRFFHWELEFPEVFYRDSSRLKVPGFDAVVGNPPYANVEDLDDDEKRWLRACDSEIFNSKNDQLYHFIVRAVTLCSDAGSVSMIISRYLTEAHYAEAFRAYIANNVSIREWNDFGNLELFEGVNTRCVILVLSPSRARGPEMVVRKVKSWDGLHSALFGHLSGPDPHEPVAGVKRFTMPQSALLRPGPWTFLDAGWSDIRRKIERRSVQLGGTSGLCKIGMGWNTGMDKAFTVATGASTAFGAEAQFIRPLIKNGDIRRFEIHDRGLSWIDTSQLDLSQCPLIAQHLSRYRRALSDRYAVRASGKHWYEYAVVNMPDVFLADEKIVVPFKAPENRFALDTRQALASQDVYAVRLADLGSYRHEYLLAILNSNPMTRWYQEFYGRRKKAEFDYYSNLLERIPVRRIAFNTPVNTRERLVAQAEALCAANDRPALMAFTDARLSAQPEQADVIHDLLASLAKRMMAMNKEKQSEAKGFLDWLAGYTGLAIEDWRLKTYVKAYWEHPWDELQRALRQNRKPIQKASGWNVEGREAQEAIHKEFERSVARLDPLLERIASTDRLIDLTVYRLYGLTDEEVAIVEGRA